MENLALSFSVVFPLFLYLALGYGAKSIRMLSSETIRQMNNAVFRIFLPVLLFSNVYSTEISTAFQPGLTAFAVASVLLSFALSFGAVCLLEKENARRGVLIQGIFRSNFVLFGVPVSASLFGAEASGIASLLIAFVIPLFNILAVAVLEIFRGGKFRLLPILKGIVTNPLILATAAALVFLATGWKLPSLLEEAAADIGGIATPLALFLLGASFTFSGAKGRARQIALGVCGRLLLVPLVFLTAAAALGFRGANLTVLLSLFGSPTAVSSFVMAQQMGGDGELAGQLVVWGSLFSVLSIFLWVFVLKQAAFL